MSQKDRLISVRIEAWKSPLNERIRYVRQSLESNLQEEDRVSSLLINSHGSSGKVTDLFTGSSIGAFGLFSLGNINEEGPNGYFYEAFKPLKNRMLRNGFVILMACSTMSETESIERLSDQFMSFFGARDGTLIAAPSTIWLSEFISLTTKFKSKMRNSSQFQYMGILTLMLGAIGAYDPGPAGVNLTPSLAMFLAFSTPFVSKSLSPLMNSLTERRNLTRGFAIRLENGKLAKITSLWNLRRTWRLLKRTSCERILTTSKDEKIGPE